MKNDLDYAISLIRQADGILITAGAGMSVDSGLPDFRSSGGFWNAYPQLQKTGLTFAQIATPQVYQDYPDIAYWFFGHRLNQYRNAILHEGYQILKRWGEAKPNGYFVFTSNVDGQFQKAGFDHKRICEIHGTLHRLQCMKNCKGLTWSSDEFMLITDDEQCKLLSNPPRCPYCNGLARQNVLMFNDYDFANARYLIQKTHLQSWLARVNNLVVIELGAGKAVPTVRNFSERTAKQKKVGFIRINNKEAGVPKMHFLSLEMNILNALKMLDERLILAEFDEWIESNEHYRQIFPEVLSALTDNPKLSISSLQRQFSLGFNSAIRMREMATLKLSHLQKNSQIEPLVTEEK